MEDQEIYKLKLHECYTTKWGITIIRVPGDWIYNAWDNTNDCFNQGIFISYDNDCKLVSKS